MDGENRIDLRDVKRITRTWRRGAQQSVERTRVKIRLAFDLMILTSDFYQFYVLMLEGVPGVVGDLDGEAQLERLIGRVENDAVLVHILMKVKEGFYRRGM